MNNQAQKHTKKKKFTCYVVFRGRKQGIYTRWEEVIRQVDGFKDPYYRGYLSQREAHNALHGYRGWANSNRNPKRVTQNKNDHGKQ